TFTMQDGQVQRLDPLAFDAVVRSVDQGLPIDAVRIRERMEQALAAGTLTVALAEGELAIADGQVRLANTMVRAQGADLAVSGSVVLTDETLDTKLVLTGPARADAPTGTRPELAVTLKGPTAAPRRTLDVASLSSWLALRAVEQQSKRIDALESGRHIAPPVNHEPEAAPPPAATPPRA